MNIKQNNKFFLFSLWMMILLAGCGGNSKNNQKEKPDSSEDHQEDMPHSPFESDMEKIFQNPALEKWKKQMKKDYPHFSSSLFERKEKDSLQENGTQKFSTEKWNTFRPYFILSPDQSKAIDLYSYGAMPPDSSGVMEGGDPDSEVNLVSLPNRTKTRLLFAGPGTAFQQAGWLNDSLIVITGESDANIENETLPMLWQINIHSRAIAEYRYRDTTR